MIAVALYTMVQMLRCPKRMRWLTVNGPWKVRTLYVFSLLLYC